MFSFSKWLLYKLFSLLNVLFGLKVKINAFVFFSFHFFLLIWIDFIRIIIFRLIRIREHFQRMKIMLWVLSILFENCVFKIIFLFWTHLIDHSLMLSKLHQPNLILVFDSKLSIRLFRIYARLFKWNRKIHALITFGSS